MKIVYFVTVKTEESLSLTLKSLFLTVKRQEYFFNNEESLFLTVKVLSSLFFNSEKNNIMIEQSVQIRQTTSPATTWTCINIQSYIVTVVTVNLST